MIRGRLATAVVAATTVLAGASPAQADICDGTGLTQEFLPWGDAALYALVDNGEFEAGTTGWTLTGKAGVIQGGNPHRAGSSASALSLPAGSSATSPPICVSHGSPTARMFARTVVRNPAYGSSLKVEVLYTDATRGGQAVKSLGTIPDLTAFDPTRKFSLAQGQLDIKPDSGGRTWIRYRFTPLYKTSWVIDDLFVDPRRRR